MSKAYNKTSSWFKSFTRSQFSVIALMKFVCVEKISNLRIISTSNAPYFLKKSRFWWINSRYWQLTYWPKWKLSVIHFFLVKRTWEPSDPPCRNKVYLINGKVERSFIWVSLNLYKSFTATVMNHYWVKLSLLFIYSVPLFPRYTK